MARILLVEPDMTLAKQYTTAFEAAGHSVSWSRDAQSAVNRADTAAPDVVIIELLLSGHSGIEFLYEFRSYADWKTVPAIILSRMHRDDIKVSDSALVQLGVAEFMYKPQTSLKRLTARLDALLAESAAGTE